MIVQSWPTINRGNVISSVVIRLTCLSPFRSVPSSNSAEIFADYSFTTTTTTTLTTTRWLVPSRPLVNPPEAKPPGSSWPPRQLASPPPPPVRPFSFSKL